MWDYFVAFIFGVVEGITEWIPVSSTGHMIILNEFLKLNVSPEFYDLYLVVIQLGAILAVMVFFWWDIWPFGVKRNNHPLSDSGIGRWIMKDKFIMWFKILVACIPAAIVGVLFDDWLDEHLYNYVVVALALIVFGIAFIVVEHIMKDKEFKIKTIGQINWGHAFMIGMFQLLVMLLKPVTGNYIFASTVGARVISAVYNYTVNRKLVFKSKSTVASSGVRYFVLCVVQMILSALLVSFFYGIIKIPESLVKIVVDTVLFLISYRIQKRFVF